MGGETYRFLAGHQEIQAHPERFAQGEQLVESRRGLASLMAAERRDVDAQYGGELLLRQPPRLPGGGDANPEFGEAIVFRHDFGFRLGRSTLTAVMNIASVGEESQSLIRRNDWALSPSR